MNKLKEKKSNYNAEILIRLQEKYGLSLRFIRMSLGEKRKSEMSDRVIKDYQIMSDAISELLKSL